MRPALLAVLAVLLSPPRAEAMHVRGEVHLVAWSGDGATALLHDAQSGPEGGGSSTFLLVSAAGVRRFLLSSDFSPGNGSRPQSVPETACGARAEELAALLKRSGFTGVKVRTGRCLGRDRYDVVDLDPRQAERASASALPPGREERGWQLSVGQTGTAELAHGRGPAIPVAGTLADVEVFLSPGERMILVFGNRSGDRELRQVVAIGTDGVARAVPL